MKNPPKLATPPIKELFHEWQDFDIAEYYLCCLLGLVDYDETNNVFRENKGVFCTNNRMSDVLSEMVQSLIRLGILEENEDGQYRYNTDLPSLTKIAYNR